MAALFEVKSSKDFKNKTFPIDAAQGISSNTENC